MMHHGSHIHHRLHINNSKKTHIVLSLTLRQFAYGMMAIFVPIYLLTAGYSLTEVAFFYLITVLGATLSVRPVMSYIRHFGVNHALALSYIFTAVYTLGLYISQYSFIGLVIAAIFGSVMGSIYWTAQWIDLARIFDSKHMNENIGNLKSLSIIAAAIAPLVGGIIAETAGPSYALLASFAVFVLAILVIQKELRTERQHPGEYILKIPKKSVIRDSLSNIGMSFQPWVSEFLWPLYIWLLHETFTGIGFMFTMSSIIAILILRKAATFDDANKFQIFRVGVFSRSLTHLIRPFVSSLRSIFIVEQIAGTTDAQYWTTYASRYMKHAKQAGTEKYIFYFETIGRLGSALVWGLLIILLSFHDNLTAIRILFFIAVPMTLTAHLINRPLQKN